MTVKDAKALIQENSFELRLLGEGDRVVEQFPLAGSEVAANSTVILYLKEE